METQEQDAVPFDRNGLLSELRTVLAENALLSEEEDLHPYESDGLTAYRRLPMLVCLPETVDQVQQIMRICYERQVPVVARGAGTGLSGGALPHSEGVLLSLAKFTHIIDIDLDNRIARVEPGVRNIAISQAVAEHGLFYAPDPSSQIACTIGGNVAENSGGVHCLKYGLTVHNIYAVTIVTMEGDLVDIGGPVLEQQGYDLLALMTGSEGLLGVMVEVTVRLLPMPQKVQVLMAAFDDIGRAATTVGSIIASGIIPAGLEMMDRKAVQAAEAFVHSGYPEDAEALLICELDGSEEDVAVQLQRVETLLEQGGATEVRVAHDEAEQRLFWAGRKAAFPAVGRLAPDYYCMDGTIPRHCLPEVLQKINEWSVEFDLPVANVFHAGDGNLHPLILYDANQPGQLERTEQFGAKILELCVEVGGTVTGEHGVGVEKLDQMCIQFGAAELDQFHAVKFAFDGRGLLNPGKAVPTLHRCAEFGAMHVHKGELPFPDLERF